MSLRSDRRAAAVQVGAVLLLGFLVIAVSLYQATVVPEQNRRVEFRHSRRVQNDMVGLRDALLRAGTSRDVRPVSVELGTTYRPRVFFVNPPPPGGILHNGTPRTVTIANARATNDETADFLNASANGPYALTTEHVSYRPSYHVYRNAPTTSYQSGVAVDERADANDTTISDQTLVRGNEIYLVAIRGNLSRAGTRAYAVDPESISTATASTTIHNTTDGNVTVAVPSTLSADRWRRLLGDEYDPHDRSDAHHVVAVSETGDGVRLELDGDTTYRLRTALVGVGTGAEAPGAAYLTRVKPTGGADVAVEVRDRFNDPVPESRVDGNLTVAVTSGASRLDPDGVAVGEDGRATFTYAGETGAVTLTLERNGTPVLDAANGSVTVEVTDADLSGGGGGGGDVGANINPNRTDGVVLDGAAIDARTVNPGQVTPDVGVTLRNLDGTEDRDVVQARFNFYSVDRQSSSSNARDAPRSVDVSNRTLKSANNGGRYRTIAPITIPAGDTRTFTLTFYRDDSGTTAFDVQQGDFFVLSVVFDDGSTATYFVAPTG
ncbi:MAG: hypothetical protein ABEJ81_05750 [Haloferacaceae archaeon]